MENEIEKIIRQNVDIHDEDCKCGYIIGAFYIHELADKIVDAWEETRLKEISEEKKRLQNDNTRILQFNQLLENLGTATDRCNSTKTERWTENEHDLCAKGKSKGIW